MPVRARKLIRKMRGGAQAHLIEGDDGHLYVVKFTNNPQHRRILVNEWLACAFLRHLQIHVPDTAVVELSDDFVNDNEELYMTVGSRRDRIEPGYHFGSKMAVHPDRVAVFDFLPEALLNKIENRFDFLGTLVFDKWVSNADTRQAVFFRAKAKTWTPLKGESQTRVGFWAQMIDHGFAFSGPLWEFQDSPIQGLYFRTGVYNEVRSLDSFQPWLDLVKNFPLEVVDSAWKQIPSYWLRGDDNALEEMLEVLLKRRSRLPELISQMRREKPKTFANWE